MNITLEAAYIGAAALIIAAVIGGIFLLIKSDKNSQSAVAKHKGQAINSSGGGNSVNAGGNVHIGNVTTNNAITNNAGGANVYQNPNSEYSPKPSPKDIEKAIKDHPPLQRKVIADHYIGVKVVWPLSLLDVSQKYIPSLDYLPKEESLRSKYVQVIGSYSEKNFSITAVVSYVLLEDYPQLNILKAGHKYQIRGEIVSADSTITLKNAALEISPDA